MSLASDEECDEENKNLGNVTFNKSGTKVSICS